MGTPILVKGMKDRLDLLKPKLFYNSWGNILKKKHSIVKEICHFVI